MTYEECKANYSLFRRDVSDYIDYIDERIERDEKRENGEDVEDESEYEVPPLPDECFYKEKETDKIWWVSTEMLGDYRFSFDKKKVYNLWTDYDKLTEKEIFGLENPYWAIRLYGRENVSQAVLDADRKETEECEKDDAILCKEFPRAYGMGEAMNRSLK